MKNYIEVIIPRENVSDDKYKITELNYKNGDFVEVNKIIGTVESSKADIEIEAPSSGYIYFVEEIHLGAEIEVNNILCVLSEKNEKPLLAPKVITETRNREGNIYSDSKTKFSKSALELLKKNSLDPILFKEYKLVSKHEVEMFLNQEDDSSKVIESSAVFSNSIVLLGAGGHAKMIYDIIRGQNQFSIIGCTSNEIEGKFLFDVPILGKDDNVLQDLFDKGIRMAVISFASLSNPILRLKSYYKLKEIGYFLPPIIHPKALIEPSARISEGCQIMAGAIIGSDVNVGPLSIVNSGSIISHDCKIGTNVHLTPSSVLAGGVTIGDNAIIGMNSSIYINVKIGENVVVNNGVQIFKDIDDIY
jgi:sugar O-acyltransferase (sialic acid O-acetyltransferase NeuD family)